MAEPAASWAALGKEEFYSQVEFDEHRAYDLTVMAMNALRRRLGRHVRLPRERAPEWKRK
jgi:hypothetical protein